MKLPIWEREAWRLLFDVVGPLDWRRADYLVARVNLYQAVGGEPLKKFLLFPDGLEPEREQTEEDVFSLFGD